jgi:negative regulator of flagellin synthesis FlgM
MKIDKRAPLGGVQSTQAPQKAGRAGKAARAEPGRDQGHITPFAEQVHAMESELSQIDVTDSAKVENVKSAIEAGIFVINSEVVADRMIETARESVRQRGKKGQ